MCYVQYWKMFCRCLTLTWNLGMHGIHILPVSDFFQKLAVSLQPSWYIEEFYSWLYLCLFCSDLSSEYRSGPMSSTMVSTQRPGEGPKCHTVACRVWMLLRSCMLNLAPLKFWGFLQFFCVFERLSTLHHLYLSFTCIFWVQKWPHLLQPCLHVALEQERSALKPGGHAVPLVVLITFHTTCTGFAHPEPLGWQATSAYHQLAAVPRTSWKQLPRRWWWSCNLGHRKIAKAATNSTTFQMQAEDVKQIHAKVPRKWTYRTLGPRLTLHCPIYAPNCNLWISCH